MQLAWREFASPAAIVAAVTGVGLFHDLVGAGVLSPGQHIDVGRRTILFTDLVGDIALYERVGDAAAYGLVHRQLDLLGGIIERHGGHVMTTVGDAVMAAFDLPNDGARARLACIEALRTLSNPDGTSPELKRRVGVHAGPCIAIDANHHVDYFGRAVNFAARVERLGGADEHALSWSVRATEGVPAFLADAGAARHGTEDDRQRVKGVAEPVDITRIRVAPDARLS